MCRDDDMQSIASFMIADNSCDIGIIADIDNDDSDIDEDHHEASVVSIADSDTVSELTSQMIDESFDRQDSSAHGRLLAEFYVFVLRSGLINQHCSSGWRPCVQVVVWSAVPNFSHMMAINL